MKVTFVHSENKPENIPSNHNIPTHSAKSYDEFREILKEHERNTSTKYVLVAGVKRFQQKEVLVDDKQRVHWMENIPYFYYGCRLFACHQGKDRNKGQKRKYAIKRNLQASNNASIKPFKGHRQTKKLNCPVLIRLRRVVKVMIRHPEYPCLERYPNKHMKRVYTLLIRERLNKGKLLCEELYIFNLPKPEEHQYHFVGEEAIAKAISNADIKPKSGRTYCCICKSSRINRTEHIAFHRVPKSEPLLSKWRQIIGKNVKSNMHRVCSEHFPPSQFKKSIMENGRIRKVLLPNSIPRVEKYAQADVVECEEAIVTSDEQPQSTIVPLEHLYCALETADQEVEEGELYCEEVEVAVEDFQMAYVDDINTSGIRQYFLTNTQKGVPEYLEESNLVSTQESVPASTEENNPENMEVVSYFEISIPESAEEVEPEYNEESIPESIEESECVESLEEDDIHEEHVVESQKHKRRKLLQNNENYQIIVNDSISIQDQNAALGLPGTIITSRQPLNQINEKEHSLEETKKKNVKNKEELTQDCFTKPEYFQIYQRHKRKLKCEVTRLKSELLRFESQYAHLNSFLSRMNEQGIISEPPPEKQLSPLMCSIVDRALSENKPKVTPELKQFSMSLFTQSPDTYQFVSSELMNALPEEKTVKWWQKKARSDEKREQETRIYVVKKAAPESM